MLPWAHIDIMHKTLAKLVRTFLSNVHTNHTSLIDRIYHSKHDRWFCEYVCLIYLSNNHRKYELQQCNTKLMLPLSALKANYIFCCTVYKEETIEQKSLLLLFFC